MKLSISNIAWSDVQDDEMYKILHEAKFEGLEIAPTRFEPDNPYTNTASSVQKAKYLKEEYNLQISSMQSIWFEKREYFNFRRKKYSHRIHKKSDSICLINRLQKSSVWFSGKQNDGRPANA